MVDEFNTEAELKEYLSTHPTVKDSLIPNLINQCENLYHSTGEVFDLINEYNYFNKFEELVRSCYNQERNQLIELILDKSIKNKQVERIIFLDKLLLKREDEIVTRIFSQELKLHELFNCLTIPDKTSVIRSVALKQIKKSDFSSKELLTLINSLNYITLRRSSLLTTIWPQFLGKEYASNAVYDYKNENDKKLIELRASLIKELVIKNEGNLNFLFLTDLIQSDDLPLLKNADVNDGYLEWAKLEIDVRNMIPYSSDSTVSFLGLKFFMDDKGPFITRIEKILEGLTNTSVSWKYLCWFNLLKVKIHLYNEGVEFEDFDFKKLLNEPFVAFYIKNLHDLKILNSIPKMSKTFDWPNLDDIKRYFKKFEADWDEQSPLTRLGYHVGITSDLSKKERRRKLKYAFQQASSEELGEKGWGIEGSPLRLEKIAKHIANQIKIFRRHRSRDMSEAISQWKEDLEYLQSKFYDGKSAVKFIWPRVD